MKLVDESMGIYHNTLIFVWFLNFYNKKFFLREVDLSIYESEDFQVVNSRYRMMPIAITSHISCILSNDKLDGAQYFQIAMMNAASMDFNSYQGCVASASIQHCIIVLLEMASLGYTHEQAY